MEGGLEKKKEIGGRIENIKGDLFAGKAEEMRQRHIDADQECARDYPETTEKIRSWLREFNSAGIVDIFDEYLEKAGVPKERLNIPEAFYTMKDLPTGMMVYQPRINSIAINTKFFDRELRSSDEEMVRAEFEEGFFHEMAHCVSVNRVNSEVF